MILRYITAAVRSVNIIVALLILAIWLGIALAASARAATAGGEVTQADSVDLDVQTLKKELVDLNKDLFKLEEELLYPASTQVAVFVSVDVGTFFALDSVTLKVDDKEVTNYLYTEREVQALHQGTARA